MHIQHIYTAVALAGQGEYAQINWVLDILHTVHRGADAETAFQMSLSPVSGPNPYSLYPVDSEHFSVGIDARGWDPDSGMFLHILEWVATPPADDDDETECPDHIPVHILVDRNHRIVSVPHFA